MLLENDVLVYVPKSKIDGETAASNGAGVDQSELSAEIYLMHKENGNVQKARLLGEKLAEMVVQDLPKIEDNSEDWVLIDHLKLLYIFVAEQIIRENPEAILAQISLSAFREAIEKAVPGAYSAISGCSADTFYKLAYYQNEPDEVARNMGSTMAQLCGKANDWKVITIAEHLFTVFQKRCQQECKKTEFVL